MLFQKEGVFVETQGKEMIMSKIAVMFTTGYEEIEALTVVDLLRRADLECTMVAVNEEKMVAGSHGIRVEMDQKLSEVDFDSLDMIVLPGGMPGTLNLEASELLMEKVDEFYKNGKYVAAICAAPSIFGHRGILKGKKACCYPSFESHLEGAEVSNDSVCVDGKVITSRGMGTAIDFALAIISELCGEEKANQLANAIIYK